MAFIRNLTINIKAGQTEEFPIRGDGLRLVSANVPIFFKSIDGDMDFYLEQGEQALFDDAVFTRMQVFHSDVADQQIIVTVSEGSKFNGAKISGSVTVSNQAAVNGAFTQGRVSLTNVNQVIIAENPNRRSSLIQNNDASAVMRVKIDGAAATVSQGFRILAGDSLDLKDYLSTGAVNAIMETASAAAGNVEFAEG
jgi:hypothetical protein